MPGIRSDTTGLNLTREAVALLGLESGLPSGAYSPQDQALALNPPSLLKNFSIFNVKTDFGAKGDGVTNDAVALQNALNAATGVPVPSQAGDVYLPTGIFITNAALTIHSGTTIKGLNWQNSMIKLGNNVNTDVIHAEFVPPATSLLFWNRFERFGIDGNLANNPTGGDGLKGNFSQSVFDRILIQNCNGNGLRLTASVATVATLNHVFNVYTSTNVGYGIYCSNQWDWFMQNTWSGGGTQLADYYFNDCHDLHLSNILVDGSPTNGVIFDSCTLIRFNGFQMAGFASGDACIIRNSSSQIYISGGDIQAGTVGPRNAITIDTNGAGNTISQVDIKNITIYGTQTFAWAVKTQGGGTLSQIHVGGLNLQAGIISNAGIVSLGSGTDLVADIENAGTRLLTGYTLLTLDTTTGLAVGGPVSEAQTAQQIRVGMVGGTPRVIWDINTPNKVLELDNNNGVWRFINPSVGVLSALDGTAGILSTYGTIATQGRGVPAIYQAPAVQTGKTAAVASVASLTSPNDGNKHVYRISGVINITVHGTESINLQVSYTDDNGSARTATIPLMPIGGTDATAANAVGPWVGDQVISVNPNTTITVLTAGAFTGATYNVAGLIEQLL